MDEYQERYLEHQERKKHLEDFSEEENLYDRYDLMQVIGNRRSQRVFNREEISFDVIVDIVNSALYAPSSCNRQAVYLREINSNDAERLLVGGKKWIDKANKVYGVFADKLAYKSPNEVGYMPYLDAGVAIQNICLVSEAYQVGSCIVNPNIREENKEEFTNLYNTKEDYFCGAVALGYYDKKAKMPPKKEKILVC